MHVFAEHIVITLGIVLVAALFAGLLADLFRMPKVTGYLLVGVVIGPSVLDLLAHQHVDAFHPLTQLAIGLVLFSLGCHFPMSYLRRLFKRAMRLSAGELILTFATVTVGLLLFVESWTTAVLLGALALATAPATTILVLKESESEGPVTEYIDSLVMINNVACIIVFEIAFLGIQLISGDISDSIARRVGYVAQDIFGSVLLGVTGGCLISYGCSLVSPSRWMVLLIGVTTILLGFAEFLGFPYLLCFLGMGLTVANLSENSNEIVAKLDGLTGFLCVVFFVVHGAELDLKAFVNAGVVGAAYVVLRSLGKYCGIFTAAHLAHEPPAVRTWLGSSLLAQAGAAIALSAVAVSRDPALGTPVQTIILGTIVVFEIAGPLLIRFSLLRAGEVPLARAVHHSTATPLDEVRNLWRRMRLAWGAPAKRRSSEETLTVASLFRKSVAGLDQSALFTQVVSLIQHSHDNTYAVIDDQAQLVGVIRYTDLSHVAFDRSAANLVRAMDLASAAENVLRDDDSVEHALNLFRKTDDDCIPVVTSSEPHRYLGVLRRRDIVGYFVPSTTSDH